MSNNFLFYSKNATEYIEKRMMAATGPDEDLLRAYLKKFHCSGYSEESNKLKLVRTLIQGIGVERCEKLFNLGVSAYYFKEKYSCDTDSFNKMVLKGLIHQTGTYQYTKDGVNRFSKLYSVIDYFTISLNDYLLWSEANKEVR